MHTKECFSWEIVVFKCLSLWARNEEDSSNSAMLKSVLFHFIEMLLKEKMWRYCLIATNIL